MLIYFQPVQIQLIWGRVEGGNRPFKNRELNNIDFTIIVLKYF